MKYNRRDGKELALLHCSWLVQHAVLVEEDEVIEHVICDLKSLFMLLEFSFKI